MKVYAFESEDWAEAAQHGVTPEKAVEAIERGLSETKNLLPTLSDYINVVVRPNDSGIMPETGTGAYTHDSEFIEITIDKTVPHGAEDMLKSLYEIPFHEGNHAARYNVVPYDDRFIVSAIYEGLATVFEREYSGYKPPYGNYEDDETMAKWFEELKTADWGQRSEMMFMTKDNRRWVGYKTGTWLVDKAIKNSGKSIVELTTLPADDIFKFAGVEV